MQELGERAKKSKSKERNHPQKRRKTGQLKPQAVRSLVYQLINNATGQDGRLRRINYKSKFIHQEMLDFRTVNQKMDLLQFRRRWVVSEENKGGGGLVDHFKGTRRAFCENKNGGWRERERDESHLPSII
uniref:Uncharacterized protein n=1 Tax=Cucumis sativus TaxID=3659 RepID=A0A0A0L497_CUCSA